MTKKIVEWRRYEDVARTLLNRFSDELGIGVVEGKKILKGESTEWEVDAHTTQADGGSLIIVECRRRKSRQTQEDVGGIVFKVSDLKAAGAIHVSPLGLQKGGQQIADKHNILSVLLNKDATPEEYVMQFKNALKMGIKEEIVIKLAERVSIVVRDTHGNIIDRREFDG